MFAHGPEPNTCAVKNVVNIRPPVEERRVNGARIPILCIGGTSVCDDLIGHIIGAVVMDHLEKRRKES